MNDIVLNDELNGLLKTAKEEIMKLPKKQRMEIAREFCSDLFYEIDYKTNGKYWADNKSECSLCRS